MTILSEDMEKYFAKLQQSREAREAADKLYVDQIRALKSIWETNEDGRGKSNTAAALNEMHAANKELTEGMLETHTAFATLFDDEVTYEDGLNRLTEMERLSVKQSQEKTKALMDEAEATRKLNEQKKDNYAALINEMADTFTADGYDAFVAKWEALPEAVKNDLIALVPEVAKLAAGMYDAADGAAIFANALNNINATKLEAFTRAMNEASEKRVKSDAARAAKDNRYDSQLKDFSKILRDNTASEGYVKLREAMYKLKQENSDLFEGLIETYPVLTKLFGANMD